MAEERRKNQRSTAEVKVDYRSIGSFITDYSKNISRGGMFVATSLPLPPEERVRLRLTLPGRELPFALEGIVRWSRPNKDGNGEAGMGLEFADFDEELCDALQRFVDSLE